MTPGSDDVLGEGGGPPPTVELRAVSKRYGEVLACDAVDLSLRPGQIHGVLGENGAGKSTLMKMLIGLVRPDSGTILVRNREVAIHDPQTAAAMGIGMVHQHLSLVDELTVWENVLLGERRHFDRNAARNDVVATGERYGLRIDPDRMVGELSAGLRQRVEVIKCLRRDPAILILDEPTSVLTPAESEEMFTTLHAMVENEQRAVALVSHKLAEILHATDVVTIMRQGGVVEHRPTSGATAAGLATAMVGRVVSLRDSAAVVGATDDIVVHGAAPSTVEGPPVLQLHNVTVRRHGVAVLDGLSLAVRAGEIVGVAGVEGNGQRELGDVLSSLIPLDHGTVTVDGVAAHPGRAGNLARLGVAVIPEDRHDSGCVLSMTVAENLLLDHVGELCTAGFIRHGELRRRALELIDEFEIQGGGPDTVFAHLSGGNQQRVVLARELSRHPKVLVAAQPTRGLDVGAIEFMTTRLRAASASGIAVLLISTEIEEILDLADRIVVLNRGTITGELRAGEATSERLGLLLGGMSSV